MSAIALTSAHSARLRALASKRQEQPDISLTFLDCCSRFGCVAGMLPCDRTHLCVLPCVLISFATSGHSSRPMALANLHAKKVVPNFVTPFGNRFGHSWIVVAPGYWQEIGREVHSFWGLKAGAAPPELGSAWMMRIGVGHVTSRLKKETPNKTPTCCAPRAVSRSLT